MNFLLTNDDGIHAPGLWVAARVLAQLGKVLVVAPSRNYSGYGPAHPPQPALSCVPFRGEASPIPHVTAYALSSTPATCVHVGLSGVLATAHIDVVVSGVNDALNLGRDVLYSGTVGAAMTAFVMGIPAIALSLDAMPAGISHWDSAAWAVEESFKIWDTQHRQSPIILNVNVPNAPRHALKGAITTFLGNTSFLDTNSFDRDAHDAEIITLARRTATSSASREPWSDAWAVKNGFVSVTPLRLFPDIIAEPDRAAAPTAVPLPMLVPAGRGF